MSSFVTSYLTVYHSHASCQRWKGCSFQAKSVKATRSNEQFKDPDWKKFPFSLLIEFNRFLPYSEASYERQDDHDSGSLCATALLVDRSARVLLNSVGKDETTDIPVPLRCILPELVRALRQIGA